METTTAKTAAVPYRFTVHMLAFAREYCTRTVSVPKEEVDNALKSESRRRDDDMVCDLVYHYGQNDFQPLPCPSVSKGDVIELWDRRMFIVQSVGFQEIGIEDLIKYVSMSQRDRQFCELVESGNQL